MCMHTIALVARNFVNTRGLQAFGPTEGEILVTGLACGILRVRGYCTATFLLPQVNEKRE